MERTMKFDYPRGATLIDPNEAGGLIPSHVTTQTELNELEQANIARAQLWAFRRKHREWLSENFIRLVHKKMFGDVWKWAGHFRKTQKNLGVDSSEIIIEIHKLCEDTKYWLTHQSFSWDELAARFHHRLVSIHPFPNGNGRQARLMTDILLWTHDQPVLTWGAKNLSAPGTVFTGTVRTNYILALKKADAHSMESLIRFVRS